MQVTRRLTRREKRRMMRYNVGTISEGWVVARGTEVRERKELSHNKGIKTGCKQIRNRRNGRRV
jgi:hypothetical protein